MRRVLWASLAVGALCAGAQAETVRFPESGTPAFVVQTPDGWTHKADDSNNVLLLSPDHASSFSLSMTPWDGAAADLAVKALATTTAAKPQPTGKQALAGFDGDAFDTTMTNSSGEDVDIHLIAAKPDPGHVATVAVITIQNISADDRKDVQSILDNIDIDTGDGEK